MKAATDTKQGYKKTKIGWIPEDWQHALIKECLNIENNKRTPISEEVRKNIQGEFPYYGPTKIQDFINTYQYNGRYALIAEDGDHFLKFRETSMTQIVEGKFNVNNHAHVIKGTDRCTTDWFFWYFNRRSVYSHITRQGAGRFKLNKASLEKLELALPPLPEQKKIAQILSAWDKAINQKQELIRLLLKRKKGLMQQLLTGKTRLNGFNDNWINISLVEVLFEPKKLAVKNAQNFELLTVKLHCKGIESTGKYPNVTVNGRPYYLRNEGEILIGRQNFHNGGFGIVPKKLDGYIASNAITSFLPKDNCDLDFLIQYFSLTDFYKKVGHVIGGTGQKEISTKEFLKLKIHLPSLQEQKEIAKILTAADNEIKLHQKNLEFLNKQKKGLMQKLLTGQIRVKI